MKHEAMDYRPTQPDFIIVKDPDNLAPHNQGFF